MTNYRYILLGQTPVPEPDLYVWARWFETADRRVALTRLPWCEVSTVFLGMDHGFGFDGPPVLFETLAFWSNADQYEGGRCCTWLQAEQMHEHTVREVSRLSAIWRYAMRVLRDSMDDAREDWRRSWQSLRGRRKRFDWDMLPDEDFI